jgi:hypothetical protein
MKVACLGTFQIFLARFRGAHSRVASASLSLD